MRPVFVVALAAAAGLLASQFYATAAPALKEPLRFQLVGFTSDRLPGGSGVIDFTRACHVELGDDSRMCTSVEVMETSVVPSNLPAFDAGHVSTSWAQSGTVARRKRETETDARAAPP